MVPLVCLTVVVCAQTASRSRSCPAFKTGRRSSMSVGRPARALSFPRVSASGRATSSRTARCSGTRRGRLTTCIMDTGVRTRHTPNQQRRCVRPSLLALLLSAHQSVYAGRWWQMACLAMLIHSRGGDASAAPFARRLLSALAPETVGDVSGYLFESEDQKPPLVRRLRVGRISCAWPV